MAPATARTASSWNGRHVGRDSDAISRDPRRNDRREVCSRWTTSRPPESGPAPGRDTWAKPYTDTSRGTTCAPRRGSSGARPARPGAGARGISCRCTCWGRNGRRQASALAPAGVIVVTPILECHCESSPSHLAGAQPGLVGQATAHSRTRSTRGADGPAGGTNGKGRERSDWHGL